MAMRDDMMVLSDAQVVTLVADNVSTDVYDNGAAMDSGIGESLTAVVGVRDAVTSGGAATVTPVLQTSDDNITFTDLAAGEAFTVPAGLVAGTRMMELKIPSGGGRFLRFVLRVEVAALLTGSFDAYFVKDTGNNVPYASGFTA